MSFRARVVEEICATYKNVDLFCIKVEKTVKELKLDNELFTLTLLLKEGLNNAIKHGCRNDESLKIKCCFIIYDNEYIIEIEDPGDGFYWRNSKREADMADTSGRGLSIIQNYSSSFFYNEKGNKLTIRKLLNNRGVDDV